MDDAIKLTIPEFQTLMMEPMAHAWHDTYLHNMEKAGQALWSALEENGWNIHRVQDMIMVNKGVQGAFNYLVKRIKAEIAVKQLAKIRKILEEVPHD